MYLCSHLEDILTKDETKAGNFSSFTLLIVTTFDLFLTINSIQTIMVIIISIYALVIFKLHSYWDVSVMLVYLALPLYYEPVLIVTTFKGLTKELNIKVYKHLFFSLSLIFRKEVFLSGSSSSVNHFIFIIIN